VLDATELASSDKFQTRTESRNQTLGVRTK
jgi:hypothetical protein